MTPAEREQDPRVAICLAKIFNCFDERRASNHELHEVADLLARIDDSAARSPTAEPCTCSWVAVDGKLFHGSDCGAASSGPSDEEREAIEWAEARLVEFSDGAAALYSASAPQWMKAAARSDAQSAYKLRTLLHLAQRGIR